MLQNWRYVSHILCDAEWPLECHSHWLPGRHFLQRSADRLHVSGKFSIRQGIRWNLNLLTYSDVLHLCLSVICNNPDVCVIHDFNHELTQLYQLSDVDILASHITVTRSGDYSIWNNHFLLKFTLKWPRTSTCLWKASAAVRPCDVTIICQTTWQENKYSINTVTYWVIIR